MDYRELLNKLDNIDTVTEALSQDQINAALQGKTNPQQRAAILNNLAMQNGLPGLYDPQTGTFVKATSPGQPVQTAQQGDPAIDKQLAAKGLVPNYARLSGDASNEFERGAQQSLRSQSATMAKQAAGADVKKQLATLQQLVGELERIQGSEFEKSYYYESISKNLVESFGYEVQDEGVGALAGKALPGVGLVLGASDAYDRWKKGDKKGAALSGAGALASLIPGIGTAASLGIGAYQTAMDNPEYVQAAKEKMGIANQSNSSNKVLDIQKKLIAKGAKIKADGVMGPATQAAMKKYGIHEEFSVAESIRQLQDRLSMLESDEVNPYHSDEMFSEDGEEEFDAFFQELNRLGGTITGEPGSEMVNLPGEQPIPFADLVSMAASQDQAVSEDGRLDLLKAGAKYVKPGIDAVGKYGRQVIQYLAKTLAPAVKATPNIVKKGAGAITRTAKKYPKTTAAAGVAAGLGAAGLSGDTAGSAGKARGAGGASGSAGGQPSGGAGPGGAAKAKPAGSTNAAGKPKTKTSAGSPEMEKLPLGQNLEVQEIVRQIKPVLASLKQHLADPNVRNAVADAQAKIMGIKGLPRV